MLHVLLHTLVSAVPRELKIRSSVFRTNILNTINTNTQTKTKPTTAYVTEGGEKKKKKKEA